MPKFYSRAGDDGYTGRLGDGRVAKQTSQIDAIGSLDEASAALGVARVIVKSDRSTEILLQVQRDLYLLMAEVSATPDHAARFRKIDREKVIWLETQIDSILEIVQLPDEFILPGDTQSGAAMAFARTVVRRAERSLARLNDENEFENEELLPFMNRLSTLCFVLEILENQASGSSPFTLAKQ